MVIEKKNEEPQTLEAGLDFWSRQEQKFKALFGQESLKDREFLKMKLRHYDNLWYQYKSASLGIEGQLMRNMLKFQRGKIEKALHLGLLRTIIRKINTTIKANRAQKMHHKVENRSRLELYTKNSPKPENQEQKQKTAVQQKKEDQIKHPLEMTEKVIIPQPEITKQEQTKSYNHNKISWHKHKKTKNNGIHH